MELRDFMVAKRFFELEDLLKAVGSILGASGVGLFVRVLLMVTELV